MSYGDVEELLASWIPTAHPGTRACTELPADLTEALPLVRIARISGGDDVPSLDRAVVDVEYFDATRKAAHDGAEDLRHLLRFVLPGQTVDGVTVARVRTLAAPTWRPYDNPNVRRYGASYELVGHNPG